MSEVEIELSDREYEIETTIEEFTSKIKSLDEYALNRTLNYMREKKMDKKIPFIPYWNIAKDEKLKRSTFNQQKIKEGWARTPRTEYRPITMRLEHNGKVTEKTELVKTEIWEGSPFMEYFLDYKENKMRSTKTPLFQKMKKFFMKKYDDHANKVST